MNEKTENISMWIMQVVDIERLSVNTADVVNSDLWRLFPVINVDRVEDIPCDYPGAMGVPITFMNKIQRNDGSSGFLLIDTARPTIDGKQKYQRLIIRNLRPNLPDEIDIVEWLNKTNSQYTIDGLVIAKHGKETEK